MLTAERIRELFDYDKASGVLTRRSTGKPAGTRTHYGYLSVRVDGRTQLVHRLAWCHVHGQFPREQIDHMNGLRTDNRLANLREATSAENRRNQQRPLFRGRVVSDEQGFHAVAAAAGAQRSLGCFATAKAAETELSAARRRVRDGGAL